MSIPASRIAEIGVTLSNTPMRLQVPIRPVDGNGGSKEIVSLSHADQCRAGRRIVCYNPASGPTPF